MIAAYAEDVRAFFDWRRTSGHDGPFFLMINFHDPHRPFREQFVDAGASPFDSVDVPPWLPDLPEVRSELRMYLQYIERLDRGVGLCLAELRAAGVAEETIVFYTSDHGAAFPFAKTTLYEAGLSVPLVASAPGCVSPGTRTDALVSFVDFAPTVLELAGAPVPARARGDQLRERARRRGDRARRERGRARDGRDRARGPVARRRSIAGERGPARVRLRLPDR